MSRTLCHLTLLVKFAWPSSAYVWTQVAYNSIIHSYLGGRYKKAVRLLVYVIDPCRRWRRLHITPDQDARPDRSTMDAENMMLLPPLEGQQQIDASISGVKYAETNKRQRRRWQLWIQLGSYENLMREQRPAETSSSAIYGGMTGSTTSIISLNS